MTKLYTFFARQLDDQFWVEAQAEYDGRAVLRGDTTLMEPVLYSPVQGNTLYDVIGTTWSQIHLYCKRFFDALQSGGFTGWNSFAARIHGEDDKIIDSYRGLVVLGRCGPLDFRKAKLRWNPPELPQGRPYPVAAGPSLDIGSWDGNDFVIAQSTSFVLVTERVRDALANMGIDGIRMTQLDEFEMMLIALPEEERPAGWDCGGPLDSQDPNTRLSRPEPHHVHASGQSDRLPPKADDS